MEKARRITIYGRVQGVGFRPRVGRLALKLGLKGLVRNLGGIVEIIAQGEEAALGELIKQLQEMKAPAKVERIIQEELPLQKLENFTIAASEGRAEGPYFPGDIAICPKCRQELQLKNNRRYKYPYISCAQCGPRYTIMKALPYDRSNTTMDSMELCTACREEYLNVEQRRGRAETISCQDCGPQLYGYVRDCSGPLIKEAALEKAKQLLKQGKILLIKSVGGYNLVCQASSAEAVKQLRGIKHRPTKPLAVLCPSLELAKQLCFVNDKEQEMLESRLRPIVLLQRRQEAELQLAPQVADNCPSLGVFLPPLGLYHLLSEEPLIVTSCNNSGQHIIYKDDEAEQYYRKQENIAGYFTYNREILRPADDAVVKIIKVGKNYYTQVLRRTRGYMPEPIEIEGVDGKEAVLALGAQLEPGFSLYSGKKIYAAQVPGELAELTTERHWQQLELEWERLLNITPRLLVADLHPAYTSTDWVQKLSKERNLPFVQVQHHQAHALSVMAEQGIEEKCLAICFDGTGYGSNGSIWGGEFLVCAGSEYTRAAHLEELPMLGGDESMKQAWKSALCYGVNFPSELGEKLAERDKRYAVVKAALSQGLNIINNSSMGRLFDAAAAILGIAEYNSHQGACPQALEYWAQLALDQNIKPLELHFTCQADERGEIVVSTKELWPQLVKVDKKDKQQIASAALGFHLAVIELIGTVAKQICIAQEIDKVILTGGCFANRILLEKGAEIILSLGLKIYFNEKVPPGDGGITLGQAYYGIIKSKTALK